MVCLKVCRIDYDRLRKDRFRGKALHQPGKGAFFSQTPPTIAEGLRRAILPGCIAPPQPIATDEGYASRDAPIIDATLAMTLGEKGLQLRHLDFRHPE